MASTVQSVLKSPHRRSSRAKCVPFSLQLERNNKSHLIEYMETPLSRIPHDDTRLLQKEVGDFPSVWFSAGAELDLKVFPLMDESMFCFSVSGCNIP